MKLTNIRPPASLLKKIDNSIRRNPKSILLSNLFHKMNQCIDSSCKEIQPIMEKWNRVVLEAANLAQYRYFLGSNLAVQGRFKEALQQLDMSIRLSPVHLSPYITKIEIYLAQGKLEQAKKTYSRLKAVNIKLYGVLTSKVLKTGKRISNFKSRPSQLPRNLPAT